MKIAHRIKIGLCHNPRCRSMHIWFYDSDGTEQGAIAIRPANIQSFINDMQDFAYEAAATRIDDEHST